MPSSYARRSYEVMELDLQVIAERNLQPHPSWLNKCIQLYETSLVRHGIMLVGPPGTGKSTMMDCLAAALTEMGQKTVIWRMNPKVPWYATALS